MESSVTGVVIAIQTLVNALVLVTTQRDFGLALTVPTASAGTGALIVPVRARGARRLRAWPPSAYAATGSPATVCARASLATGGWRAKRCAPGELRRHARGTVPVSKIPRRRRARVTPVPTAASGVAPHAVSARRAMSPQTAIKCVPGETRRYAVAMVSAVLVRPMPRVGASRGSAPRIVASAGRTVNSATLASSEKRVPRHVQASQTLAEAMGAAARASKAQGCVPVFLGMRRVTAV